MDTFFITIFGTFLIVLGRLMLKNWFNHLTIYSFIWTAVLWLTTLRLIKYNPIIMEAWIFMIAAWLLLYLGSAVVILAKKVTGDTSIPAQLIENPNIDEKRYFTRLTKILSTMIIVLSVLGVFGLFSHGYVLIKKFGSFMTAFAYTSLWYHLRQRGMVSEGIPYLSSIILACCSFAGVYSGIKNRITFISILPLILVIVHSFFIMGRADILIAITLFITTYMFSLRYFSIKKIEVNKPKWVIPIIAVFLLAVVSADQVRTSRNIGESFRKYGESKSMSILRNIPFFTPSVYFYISGEPVVLSEYLKKGGERVYPGWYTFAPIFRVLARFGLVEKPPYVPPFYPTPIPMNTGTYLREVHADFGESGVTLLPFLLGMLCTLILLHHSFSLTNIIILSHLYVCVVMSFITNAIGDGNWLISFLVSIAISYLIDKKNKTLSLERT